MDSIRKSRVEHGKVHEVRPTLHLSPAFPTGCYRRATAAGLLWRVPLS